MIVRHLARKVGIGAAASVGGLLLFAGAAGAVTGSVAPIGTVTSGIPYSSGQTVKVSAPSGSGLPNGSNVTILSARPPTGSCRLCRRSATRATPHPLTPSTRQPMAHSPTPTTSCTPFPTPT